MVIIMLYILFNILKYCIDFYKLASLDEVEELLSLKAINYTKNIIGRGIIVYQDNDIIIEQVLSYSDNVIRTNDRYILKPNSFIIINNLYDFSYVKLLINLAVFSSVIIFINYNIYVSFSLLTLSFFLKSYKHTIFIFLCVIIIINLVVYQDYYVLLSLVLVAGVYKYQNLLYLSIVPFFFNIHITNIYMTTIYFCLLVLFKYNDINTYYQNKILSLNLIVKQSIPLIDVIKIDQLEIFENGKYFVIVNKHSKITINNINIKFVCLELLTDKFKIVYIKNRNSFFTNRRKYSKIKECDKIYIYLFEVD